MSSDLGLTLDGYSWPLYLGLVAFWIYSVRLVPEWNRLGWQAVPMSLFGFVWVGFALSFIVRFPLLSWDSLTFGNMTSRLADATSEQVNFALFLAAIYFACLVGAYRMGRYFIAKRLKIRVEFQAERSRQAQVLLAFLSTIGIVLSSGHIPVPLAFLTPLGLLGSLWIIPACLVWWDRFHYRKHAGNAMCWLFLLPGLLRAVLSPYRENLLMPVFAILLAALFAGRRVRMVHVLTGMLALFFVSTIIITGYRQVLWEDATVTEAWEYSASGYTLEKSYDAKWAESLRRFHGFDSLLLTVRYVPEILPHSERNVVVAALVRGVVPRAIYEEKEGSTRGVDFGQSIWSYGGESSDSWAPIAPSMPGDLYEVFGVAMVSLGGMLWGLFLGLLEGWKARLSPKAAAALTALFSLQCFASVERDFAHVVSTMIQYLIVMFIVAKLIGGSTGRRATEELKRRPV